jgi:TonB family protein
MHNNAFLALPQHRCMLGRLIDELQEAWREFRDGPKAYFTGALKGDAGGDRRKQLLHLGLAIGILIYALVFASMLVFWSLAHRGTSSVRNVAIYTPLTSFYRPKAELPNDEDKSGGGGGGGRNEKEPPSGGSLPLFSLAEPVVAPRPAPPLKPPSLPVIETVNVDPRIQFERDDLSLTGLPNVTAVIPSAGPGSDAGMGTGFKGGIGPGVGRGVGPGRDGNIGGDGFKIGGVPNGGSPQSVDSRPVLLNQPRPFYSEQARQNKVQGVVRVRVLVDSTGVVKEVVVMRGLPDGLNEQAIRAAYQMRFRPAMKDGRSVSYWLSVEIEFNLR